MAAAADPKCGGGGGSMCLKYTLLLFNVIYLLGGLAMITMGTIAFIQAGSYPFGGQSTVRPAAVLVLSVGAAVCLLAAYGCAHALLGNNSVSIPYLAALVLLFLAKIAGVATGFAQVDQISDTVYLEMRSAIVLFDKNDPTNAASIFWNQIQTKLMCCGMDSNGDWKGNAALNGFVPDSCCVFPSYCCGCKVLETTSNYYPYWNQESSAQNNIYRQGCARKSIDFLKTYMTALGAVSAAVAGLQGVLVLLAICMACCVHNCRKIKLLRYLTNVSKIDAMSKSFDLATDSQKEQLLSNPD